MNMYEFGKCDTETQKFLICIFEVGSWYVNNVYTQLGGNLSAREVDDSSKFAAAVYYYYINKEILKDEKLDDRVAYGIDLWGTSSEKFLMVSSFIKKVLKSNKFEFVVWDDIEDDDDKNSMQLKIFKLKPGDLLCRKGNVEFYIGNDRFVNWGSVHKTYSVKKEIDKEHYNYYIDSKNTLYTAFIRFKGVE